MIIPLVAKVGDLEALVNEYGTVLQQLGKSFEFIFVLGPQHRDFASDLQGVRKRTNVDITILALPAPFHEATALAAGFDRAAGDVVFTSAAFFQVTREAIPTMLEELETADADLVVARRYPRRGSFLNRLQARVFHWLVRTLTATEFHDVTCGFRAMTRQVAEALHLYGDLHRFIPIIGRTLGFRVVEVKVKQHVEDRPTKLYGPAVYSRRILDILTVFFLVNFTRRPLRFFGLIGLGLLVLGGGITLYLGIYRLLGMGGIADRPLLLLGILLAVLGFQSISIGLLGELIIYTHARKMSTYRIAEEL
jgi:hypothetical protein